MTAVASDRGTQIRPRSLTSSSHVKKFCIHTEHRPAAVFFIVHLVDIRICCRSWRGRWSVRAKGGVASAVNQTALWAGRWSCRFSGRSVAVLTLSRAGWACSAGRLGFRGIFSKSNLSYQPSSQDGLSLWFFPHAGDCFTAWSQTGGTTLHSLESLIKRQVCKNALWQVLELTQFCMGLFLNGSINQRTDRDFSAATAVLRV